MGSMDEGRESDQCIWKLGSITGNEESLKRRRKKSHHFKRSFSLCCFLFLLFLLFRLVLEIGGRRTPVVYIIYIEREIEASVRGIMAVTVQVWNTGCRRGQGHPDFHGWVEWVG